MNKFIIFKLKEVTPAGASFSDDGTGIEVLAVPVSSISHMIAKDSEVSIFFNDVNPYDESSVNDLESIQKSVVTVSCTQGSELNLIQRISTFGTLATGNPFITFDSTGESSFDDFTGVIKAFIRNHPINRVTGGTSIVEVDSTKVTSNTINDINFGDANNKPILDLDSRDAVFGGGGGNISAWANAGTGGSTYDFSSVTNNVTLATGSIESGFDPNKNFVRFFSDSYISLANTLKVYGDYTMYFLYGNFTDKNNDVAPIIYGEDAGDTSGGVGIASNVDSIKRKIENQIGIQYAERYGDAAKADTLVDLSATTPGVLVIRRDKDLNISVYNGNGDLVASIPASVPEPIDGVQISDDGATDGALHVLHIGSAYEEEDNSFSGRLGRFGVIERDIGSTEAQRIAKDLFELYSI